MSPLPTIVPFTIDAILAAEVDRADTTARHRNL